MYNNMETLVKWFRPRDEAEEQLIEAICTDLPLSGASDGAEPQPPTGILLVDLEGNEYVFTSLVNID